MLVEPRSEVITDFMIKEGIEVCSEKFANILDISCEDAQPLALLVFTMFSVMSDGTPDTLRLYEKMVTNELVRLFLGKINSIN